MLMSMMRAMLGHCFGTGKARREICSGKGRGRTRSGYMLNIASSCQFLVISNICFSVSYIDILKYSCIKLCVHDCAASQTVRRFVSHIRFTSPSSHIYICTRINPNTAIQIPHLYKHPQDLFCSSATVASTSFVREERREGVDTCGHERMRVSRSSPRLGVGVQQHA